MAASFLKRYEPDKSYCRLKLGQFTSIYKDLNDNGKRVVVKRLKVNDEQNNQADEEKKHNRRIISESMTNIDFKNCYFINYLNIFYENSWLYLITECYDKEECLRNKIIEMKNRNQKISIYHLKDWSTKILKALEFLHSKQIVHQRLNPDNVYFKNGQPILGYNGIKANLDDPFMGNSPNYVAPEILLDVQLADYSSDCWSYGCVLYFMIFQNDLFENGSISHVKKQLNDFQLPLKIFDQHYNPNKRELESQFDSVLDKSPKKRKSTSAYINEILKITRDEKIEYNVVIEEYDDLYFTDSSYLLSGSWDNSIKVWNIETDICTQTLDDKHDDLVKCLEVLPDNLIASGSYDGTVVLWKKSNNEYLFEKSFSVGRKNQVECLKYVKSNHSLNRLLTGTSNGEIYMWNLDDFGNDEPIIFSEHRNAVDCLVLLLNNSCFASGSRDSSIKIWSLNISDGNYRIPKQRLNDHEQGNDDESGSVVTCFKKLSNNIFASGSTDSFINIYMAGTDNQFFLQREISDHSKEVKCMCALSQNLLIVGYEDGSIIVRDLNMHSRVKRLTPTENSEVECLQILPLDSSNPSLKRLATGHNNGTIIIWMIPDLSLSDYDNQEKQVIFRFERVHSSPQIGLSVNCFKILKRRYLASGGNDYKINKLSIDPFDYHVCTTYQHNGEVVCLALN